MTYKHKVRVEFKKLERWGDNEMWMVEFWGDNNKKNLIRTLKNRANEYFTESTALKLIWDDRTDLFVKKGSKWFKQTL